MAVPTPNEIRTQLAAIVQSVSATIQVIPYWALGFDMGEDIAVLRSPTDTVSYSGGTYQRVNTVMISEMAATQNPPVHDATLRSTRVVGKNLITRAFRVWYFYQFDGASETTFSTNLNGIRNAINQNRKLGFALDKAQFIDGHDKLQVPLIDTMPFGDVILHIAEGQLTVRIIEPLET